MKACKVEDRQCGRKGRKEDEGISRKEVGGGRKKAEGGRKVGRVGNLRTERKGQL